MKFLEYQGLSMRIIIYGIILSILTAVNVYADKTQDAIKYSNSLIDEQNKVAERFIELTQSFNNRNTKKIESSLNNLKEQVTSSLKSIGRMKAFDGDGRFLQAMDTLFKFYMGLCENEFPELLRIYKKNSITLTENEMGTIDGIQV